MVFHSKFSLKTIIHSFNSKSLSSWQNLAISQKKSVFWSTLEAPSEKTVHLQELVMVFKVVVNNIVDIIIPFDPNIFRSNVKDLRNHLICEFDKRWRLPEGEKCKIGSLSWRYKFTISFLITFISIKTLYDQN